MLLKKIIIINLLTFIYNIRFYAMLKYSFTVHVLLILLLLFIIYYYYSYHYYYYILINIIVIFLKHLSWIVICMETLNLHDSKKKSHLYFLF